MKIFPGILAMAAVVVASNILVQFLLGDWLTWGAITYPLAFLVTDVTNRIYGASRARKVVLAGFVTGVACSVVAAGMGLTTLRIATASGTAFLAAQMLDIQVFDKLRNRVWWQAPLVSTFLGSILDTVLFFTIAFAGIDAASPEGFASTIVPILGFGPQAPLWVSLGIADWALKMSLSILALAPFRVIVANLSGRKNAKAN